MLKNDTLKNGTSRIGLYGSAPPPPGDENARFSSFHLFRSGFAIEIFDRRPSVLLFSGVC